MASIQNLANATSKTIINDDSEATIGVGVVGNNKMSNQTFLSNKFGKRKRSMQPSIKSRASLLKQSPSSRS
jgi:hypothetical protein